MAVLFGIIYNEVAVSDVSFLQRTICLSFNNIRSPGLSHYSAYFVLLFRNTVCFPPYRSLKFSNLTISITLRQASLSPFKHAQCGCSTLWLPSKGDRGVFGNRRPVHDPTPETIKYPGLPLSMAPSSMLHSPSM